MASKRKSWVLSCALIVTIMWAPFLHGDVVREVKSRQARQPGSYPRLGDMVPALGAAGAIVAAQLLFRRAMAPLAQAAVPKQKRWSGHVWSLKVDAFSDSVFRCLFFLLTTAWGYALLRDEPWTPPVLGGKGDTRLCWSGGYPFQAVSLGLKLYYTVFVGFSLSELFILVTHERLPDFKEMLLHHTVTCGLVYYSYILNYVRIGGLVLLLHGGPDVLIYLSKALVNTGWNYLTAVSYVALVVSYIWFRICVFPAYLMRSCWLESLQEAPNGVYGWGFLNFSLFVLLMLHMYWFGLIVKIGFHFRRTGQARDMQSNISTMDMVDKTS